MHKAGGTSCVPVPGSSTSTRNPVARRPAATRCRPRESATQAIRRAAAQPPTLGDEPMPAHRPESRPARLSRALTAHQRSLALRPFIVLGDRTDHGGVVVEASTMTDTHGKGIARVGDRVVCPRRGHGTTVIVTGDPTRLLDK